ncbi:hypothetical protein E3U43_005176 [Larimichthys crocea]|uniref:Uncharacterized protein n=1 Tax=Larimichthys crocea TaxID=215358 RepID=A0ACD3QGV8_LARCR|nr:hypothetical protein E3U43_005176 [Larimichthys crocea]
MPEESGKEDSTIRTMSTPTMPSPHSTRRMTGVHRHPRCCQKEPVKCQAAAQTQSVSDTNAAATMVASTPCLESVQPPPVLDWLVQPKPRWLGGNGWLLDGPEEVLQAEACSTTEDGDEPLHCPTGYECHIINPGNPASGIPNRGQCIKQRGNSDGRSLRHKYFKDYKDYLGK